MDQNNQTNQSSSGLPNTNPSIGNGGLGNSIPTSTTNFQTNTAPNVSNFQANQADWSHFRTEPETAPQDKESVEVLKYLDPKGYKENNLNKTAPAMSANGNFMSPATSSPVKTIIRTYKNDVEEAVRYNHVSSVDIALAEQKRRQQNLEMINNSPSKDVNSFKTIIFIILGLSLLGAGAFAVYYFLKNQTPVTTVNTDNQTTTETLSGYKILRTDRLQEINLDTIDVSKLPVFLKYTVDTASLPNGNIEEFVLTKTNGNVPANQTAKKKMLDALSFMSLTGINPPAYLVRDLQAGYVFGFHSFNGNQPFLILKASSYGSIFSGMLEWERGNLVNDFKKIFSRLNQNTGAVASTDTGLPIFEDKVVNSTDSRITKDKDGRTMLIYATWNKDTIIISTNEDTIKTIINRLISSQSIQH